MAARVTRPSSDEKPCALIQPRSITVDGDRIAYRVAGKGPVLLLVHGMAGSSVTWRHVMPALAKRFRVLAPDLLGQGQSAKPRGEYSLGAHANTLRDLMDALGHKRATVVGQSLGGGVAMQFAYQFPERCERLVLVDSGGLGLEVTLYLRMLTLPGFESVFPLFCTPRLRDAGNLVARWLGRAGVRSTPAGREIWRSYASLADADSRRAFFRSLRDVIDWSGQAVSALARLHRTAGLPTLIVWGAQDPFIPVGHAVAAHEAIPGSRLEIVDGVGHYPHCEAPERFIEVLVDFIASTKPARLPVRGQRRRSSRAARRPSAMDPERAEAFPPIASFRPTACARLPHPILRYGAQRAPMPRRRRSALTAGATQSRGMLVASPCWRHGGRLGASCPVNAERSDP